MRKLDVATRLYIRNLMYFCVTILKAHDTLAMFCEKYFDEKMIRHFWWLENVKLRLVATRVFYVSTMHAVALSKKLLKLAQPSVTTLETQRHAVNAC